MEKIETITNQGRIKKGNWNGKFYAPVKTGKLENNGLVRIYVDGEPIHCRKEDIKIVTAETKIKPTEETKIKPTEGAKRKISKETKTELGRLEGNYYAAQVKAENDEDDDSIQREREARQSLKDFIAKNTDIHYNQILEKIEELEDKIKDAYILDDREREELTAMYNAKISELVEKLKLLL
jgi:uncharacterized protein YdcH (DUF465 family)